MGIDLIRDNSSGDSVISRGHDIALKFEGLWSSGCSGSILMTPFSLKACPSSGSSMMFCKHLSKIGFTRKNYAPRPAQVLSSFFRSL